MSVNKYTSCDVAGSGKLNNDVSFKIMDLSAERVRIKTEAPLAINSNVSLDIMLDSGLFQIEIKAKGKVSKKIDNGYEVIFADLPEKDRTEIDELMKSSCNMV